ncbi:hypothetical protein [Allopontixanthobacter sediminis]|uniref:Uncharacterized protein n=1 Tax=Allopontixanthobacter sediminis TaxID=1689985 RepID=A0A845AZK9_9SPHN|nr:hypothetical protein [Allopontixanthobacter sediminis]MXP43695.1 hypothetical protein [Allopontixanthobacter sediminis]
MSNGPNPAEEHQAHLVQNELIEMVNRLRAEGMSRQVISTGLAMGIADTVTSWSGAQSVAPWFARHACLVRDLQKPGD